MKSLKLSIALMLVTSFSAACGGNQAATSNANHAAGNNAQPAPATNANTAGSAAAGQPTETGDAASLYQSTGCAMCHGADGKGIPQMKDIPNFADAAWQKKLGEAAMIDALKNGKPNSKPPMPAYKNRLTDEQIKALVAYVRSFAK